VAKDLCIIGEFLMNKKLFVFEIEERSGEQEYSYTEYVYASDLTEAEELAREYTKDFYEGGHSIGEDEWSVFEIDWKLQYVHEISEIRIYPVNGNGLVFQLRDAVED
jgi:hypothetical protein